jgi:imidazoleglycerol-phosphate dehydratase/histidinol-phosphatase
MVTNQDGLGTSSFPEETFWSVQNVILKTLEGEGIKFNNIFIDRSFPEENKPTRKPGTGMLTQYLNSDYDLKNSFVIGDRLTDIQLAKNLSAKGILFNSRSSENDVKEKGLTDSCVLITDSWEKVYQTVKQKRIASTARTTKETNITVEVNLDGTGKANISTGLGFFDHMLEQIARHSLIDLQIEAKGDLHIDEHHTIEDTAITLGETFLKALGDKRGIERYAFCLPMDDCLAQVALDFGGRSWLVWETEFKREKIGEMPTEMFYHFFKSFSDAAKCNLNIKAEGTNEHHKIEAIFKAFAKAIKMAIKKEGDLLPSTKGTL